jgi:hypothetical protein
VPRYEGTPWSGLNDGAAWRRSAFHGGSPGEPDIASIPDMQVRVVPGPAGTAIRFRGSLGRSHTVWARDDLQPGTVWQKLGTANAPVAVGTVEFVDPSGIAPRYYRVTVP